MAQHWVSVDSLTRMQRYGARLRASLRPPDAPLNQERVPCRKRDGRRRVLEIRAIAMWTASQAPALTTR
jgi:hypothetical protein